MYPFPQDPLIKAIGQSHGKTAAQVVLRWHVQRGTGCVPKSVTPHRIEENFGVFGWELSAAEMQVRHC